MGRNPRLVHHLFLNHLDSSLHLLHVLHILWQSQGGMTSEGPFYICVLSAQLPRFICTVTAFYLHSYRVLSAQLPRFICTVTAFYLQSYRVLSLPRFILTAFYPYRDLSAAFYLPRFICTVTSFYSYRVYLHSYRILSAQLPRLERFNANCTG